MTAGFTAYQKLTQRFRQIAILSSTADILSWDQETFMPPKALHWRADQLAQLSGTTHRLATARAVGHWIEACEDHGFRPDTDEAANVREWRRQYDRATKLPTRLVERLERVRTLSREAWRRAREEGRFSLFEPQLQTLVELQFQLADCWGFDDSPYDALLEEYEPGATSRQLRGLFDQLCPAIGGILRPAMERSQHVPVNLLDGDYPVEAQQAFNRKVAEAMGFNFEAGRIDTSAHPFCTSLGPKDCRVTTRYNERDFTQSLYGIMHEAGHGLYDQGLPAEHFGTPLGTFCSLGIHESQSRLWENHVGRSRAFWEHWHPIACAHFPGLKRLTAEQMTGAVSRVQPSFIRVEADEVTYDLHIALRFDIESRLLERTIAVTDIQSYWNAQFERLLGLKVEDDTHGCLQDIHWSMGSFGYFPTYTLGNLNASQLMLQATKDAPGLEPSVARGDYGPLLRWLQEKVHRAGRRYTPRQLMENATGRSTATDPHLAHLRTRFLES